MGAQRTSVGAALLLAGAAALCAECASGEPQLSQHDDQRDGQPAAHLEIAAAVPVKSQPDDSHSGVLEPAGVRVEVFRCDAAKPAVTRHIGFSAGSLDELGTFAATSVRLAKDHLFARAEVSLAHGCYYATIQPLDMHQRPIDTCPRAETTEMPLGPRAHRSVVVVARCGDRPSDTPIIGGRLNFGPALTELERTLDLASGASQVCARTFDPEGDPVRVEWRARTDSGREIDVGEVHHSAQHHWRGVACVQLEPTDESIELTAVARDGLEHSARGFLSHEAYRLYRYGVVAPSRAEETMRLPAVSPLGGEASLSPN